MNSEEIKIIESSTLLNGMEIDIGEGYQKLTSSQFPGDAGRGFSELIQNVLDSYPATTPFKERTGEIEMGDCSISITDYGEGMDRDKIRLLVTIGGTDKNGDSSKIGKFGIGFFSIFNPKLGTKKVSVITKCEGRSVEIVFMIEEPGKRPLISTRILDSDIPFSTKISVEFNNDRARGQCLKFAERSLTYYPCNVTINDKQFKSVWDHAKDSNAHFFKEGNSDGFLEHSRFRNRVTLLCKYEFIRDMTINSFASGRYDRTGDLRDFSRVGVPLVSNVGITINCNDLKVTISRDSFYCNSKYDRMVRSLGRVLLFRLGDLLDNDPLDELVLANQYILRDRIKDYLDIDEAYRGNKTGDENEVVRKLSEAKVYRMSGRKGRYSLVDIKRKLSDGVPLFFSPLKLNLRWLGGNFRHDFVLIPSDCRFGSGAPEFYDTLFGCLFADVINLDSISNDDEKIRKLAERGIVDRELLSPNCSMVGERELSKSERKAKQNIDRILAYPEVMKVIERQLHIPVKSIKTAFFDLDDDKTTIATGLFNKDGRPMGHEIPDNLKERDRKRRGRGTVEKHKILIGLSKGHPFIRHLVESDDPYMAYYTLTYLAHEMALCQKLLVPFSPFFHFVKEKLASDMRKALMNHLVSENLPALN